MSSLDLVRFFSVVSFLWTVQCFISDNPCNLDALLSGESDSEPVFNTTAPVQCHNGTIYWSYPRGRLFARFPNPWRTRMHICIGDYLGGEAFQLYDVTDYKQEAMAPIERNSDILSCSKTHVSDVYIRFDAPEMQRFMGEVTYEVVMFI